MDVTTIAMIGGYLSTPLVSLSIRRSWNDQVKVLIAIAFAAITAAVASLIDGGDWSGYGSTLGLAFGVQQATWALKVPGAGSPQVNEPLLNVGSDDEDEVKVGPDAEDEEVIEVDDE